MEIRRHQNIVAFKFGSGRVVGFHALNLQVADLDEVAWNAMPVSSNADHARGARPEAQAEIRAWDEEIDPAVTDVRLPQKVRSYAVNVSQICNLKCGYCAAGGDGTFGDRRKHIDLETIYTQIQGFLHDVKAGERFDITFFGGEPLLAMDNIRLLARFATLQVAGRDIELRFRVITNATLIDAEAADLLASLQCHVTVSIDGPPEINDRQRKTASGRGSSAKVLCGINELMKVRERLGSLTFGSVFGAHNVDVRATYDYLRFFGFDSMKFDFAAQADAVADEEASRAFSRELSLAADRAYEVGGEGELRKIGSFDHYFSMLDQKTRTSNHCGAGKSHVFADARGRLSACQWFIGSVGEQIGRGSPEKTEFDEAKMQALAPSLVELNNCQTCWARHLCGGGCMFVNRLKGGSKHKKDAEFCNRTRTTIAKAIEYYAEARRDTETR